MALKAQSIARIASLAVAALFTLPLFAQAQENDDWEEFDSAIEREVETPALENSDASTADATAKVPFRRRIVRDDITVRIKTLRLNSGGKVRLVYGLPKGSKNLPAVFVLDVETNVLANQPAPIMLRASSREKRQFRQASYLLRSPFGSNMLGNGFAVAYLIADDLETLRGARTDDWIGIFDRIRDLRQIDPNNLFLFSTREYANLSVFLTTKYRFSGFILEEPTYMLFTKNTFEDVIADSEMLTPDEIWRRTDPTREWRYEEVLSQVSTPLLLIRNPKSPAYSFNDKTLIPKLNQVNAYYETIEVPGTGRSLTVFGGNSRTGIIEVSPEVSYYVPTVTRWVDEILTYMTINSSVDPVALRDPSEFRRW